MGSEASKPVVNPPEDWEPKGATKSFEIISPCSDISNPSEFNRVRYHQHQYQYQHQDQQPCGHAEASTPFSPSKPLSRRVTKNLPIAVKVRKSSSTASDGKGEVLPPGAFYFPTKKSERRAERVTKKEVETDQVANLGIHKLDEKENRFHRVARHAVKKIAKKRMVFKRMTACLDERNNRRDDSGDAVPNLISAEELTMNRRAAEKKPSTARSRRRSEQIADGDLQATVPHSAQQREVPLRKFKKDPETHEGNGIDDNEKFDMDFSERRNIGQVERVSPVLHQEDAYFDRLSLSPSANHGASPFVRSGAACSRVTAILEKNSQKPLPELTTVDRVLGNTDKESSTHDLSSSVCTTVDRYPVDRYFQKNSPPPSRSSLPISVDTPIDSPVSDLFSAHSSVPEMWDNEVSLAAINVNSSPVSSLMRFYTNTGPMDSSPKSYCSNEGKNSVQVFSDEQSETSTHKDDVAEISENDDLKRQSQESHSSLYTTESKSYKKADRKELKLLVHDDKVIDQEKSDILSYLRPEGKKDNTRKINKSDKKYEGRESKISKLESLFRPILPALSTDDAQSLSSYDPYEIKVTESAPGVIQAANYISLSLRNSSPRNGSSMESVNNELAKLSPSMSVLSIDTQQDPSPTLAEHMVSNQAQNNAEFLFTDDYGPVVIAQDPDKVRDSATFSISTAGARSRFTQRSTQKGVNIPMRSFDEVDNDSVDRPSYKNERRVRFSEDSAHFLDETDLNKVEEEVSEVERVSPDDIADMTGADSSDTFVSCAEIESSEILNNDESEDIVEPNLSGMIEETEVPIEDELSPSMCRNGRDPLAVSQDSEIDQVKYSTNSPYIFQAAKENFGTKTTCGDSVVESIDLPEIESKKSDLFNTESCKSRKSSESIQSIRSNHSIPDSVPEEDEKEEPPSDDTSIRWTYNKNGVTPYAEGKSTANPTKSPCFRFKDAKTKFNTKDLPRKKSPGKRRSSISVASSGKILRKGSGGLVSARVQELNSRVSEIRKLKRMRKKMTNPRLHTHNFDNKQPVRNRALLNYKTSIFSADTEKSNNVMAAKFNVIPDVDDDEDSAFSSATNDIIDSRKDDVEDDDISRMSEMTGVTSVATVRQQRSSRGFSMSSRTTASSGFSNLKKQVFRGSDGTRSLTSNSESTTLSSIIHKENENYLPFRATSHIVKPSEQHFAAPSASLYLSPSKKTPVQLKWRSLAAAAAEKDALKASCSKPKKTLATRNDNYEQYHIYS